VESLPNDPKTRILEIAIWNQFPGKSSPKF
jgi:hypothetical protein